MWTMWLYVDNVEIQKEPFLCGHVDVQHNSMKKCRLSLQFKLPFLTKLKKLNPHLLNTNTVAHTVIQLNQQLRYGNLNLLKLRYHVA